ncbi:MAG: FISUMP domain-containing protein [Bacteroidetes bacterium]|nr:FISUMP domain-containing protein [Bacteroidota bacterium]MDA0873708.1 FISUMP domain-containing protein [Bacteroidota bacterium]
MTRLQKFATVSEIIASFAVVVSLIYVGVQVNLNTHAIQGGTNQSLYELNQEFKLVAGADYADLKVRFARDPASITAADSVRWNGAGNGSDDLGFSARLAGFRWHTGAFDGAGMYASWWTATDVPGDDYYAWYRGVGADYSHVHRDSSSKYFGFSVRLVREGAH